ncbi:cytochrome P450 [Streptomyces sp. NPDC048277]|uniref:cytochrome P450 n=1 Tax=Streptomyces sp. NPDC048277 TaxID=3155027 RepID=UPI0033BFC5C3
MPALRILARAGFALPPALANNDGPTHISLRRMVTRFFDSGRVATALPLIERTAEELLTDIRRELDRGSACDLATQFARPLPCLVMMRMLGLGNVSPATLMAWSDAALELFYGRPPTEHQPQLADQVGEFHRWLSEQLTDGDESGLFGALRAHRMPGGGLLDGPTAVAVAFFVLVAAHATTGQLIATLLRRTSAYPQIWSRAAAEEGFAEAWLEEILRREPPVTSWRRVTAHPVELAGTRLPAGAELLLMLMGTGSDPEVFRDPEELCPYRPNLRHHLAFGVGRHRCPGASLARAEATVALRTAARRLPEAPLLVQDESDMLGLLSFRAPLRVTMRRP